MTASEIVVGVGDAVGGELAATASAATGCRGRAPPVPVSRPGSGSASSTASGHRVGRVRVGAQGGRVELAQHLAQRDGGGVPAVEQRRVRGEDGLVAGQVAGCREGHGGERAGLQRAGQPDGTALGRRRLDLLERLVVGEPLGEVVDRVVVGDDERAARRR